MKAYRSLKDKDSIHLFRPDKNVEVSTAMYFVNCWINRIELNRTEQNRTEQNRIELN
jgi:hypothetical protein